MTLTPDQPLSGPPTDLIGGHLLSLQRDALKFGMTNLREYGDLVPIKFLHYDAFQVNAPHLIGQILTKQHRVWKKSFVYRHTLADYLGEGLLVSEGDFWRRQRKLMQPAFHTQRINAYAETMTDYTRQMLDTWRAGETRDIAEDMMRLTLWIVGKTLFDTDLTDASSRVAGALENLLHDIASESRAVVRLPSWIPTPLRRRKRQTIETLDAIIMPLIEARRASGQDTGDLLSMLLLATDDDDQGMTDKQVRDEALTLVLAGHETTANALTWVLYLLSQYPHIEEKLHAEIEGVIGDRPPTLDDLDKLTYAEMVLKEGMRLYPPAWSVARQAAEDTELDGVPVRKHTSVMIITYAVHRDPRWYPQPEVFRPERWTPENEADLPRYAYLPFGGGPRICIGNAFAMMEAKLILASLVQRFRLTLAPGHRVLPEPLVTLRPKYGMQMRLHARS